MITAFCDTCVGFTELRIDSGHVVDQKGRSFFWFEIICDDCQMINQGFALGDVKPSGVLVPREKAE